ncbi:MAG TPA: ATP-binding protein [Thermoanaerobaculia bacterium]|nr:ATP-binding protein [Thermoanaerobaculia bacterium]
MPSPSLPWALFSAALLVLALVILLRQASSRVARLFCAMIALVAVWFLGFAVMLAARNEGVALAWGKIALAAVACLPAAVYDFTVTALRLATRRAAAVTAIWAASAVFALLVLFTGVIVPGVERHAWGFYPVMNEGGGALFLLFFFSVLAGHLAEYIGEYRRTVDRERQRRLRGLLVSFAIAYASVVDFFPMFGAGFPPVGYIPIAIFVIYAWQSIRHHRLYPITAARAAREIVETMADALFVIDRDARIQVINPAVTRMLGYLPSEIVGKTIDVVEPFDTEMTISRTLRDLIRRGPVRDHERVFRHKDGTLIDVSLSISPVRESDVAEGAVLIARDIRQRKAAEEELREFTRKLQQSNRELEDFAYVASHDLQEPLRKIQAFGDRLRVRHGAGLSEEGIDHLERMQNAARRMQKLINDLLAFSRVTTKAQPFARVSLEQIAREVVRDLEERLRETKGTVTIGPLPEIDADPMQMRQLFQNLIGNALKFHRPGVPPRVEVRASVSNGPHAKCEIVVRDNGIGFDGRYAERIFGMFERLHGRSEYEGTGIGLAICRKIAERHGGEITADGAPDQGAAFTVTLPLYQDRSRRRGVAESQSS